jgi:hypothetical protein
VRRLFFSLPLCLINLCFHSKRKKEKKEEAGREGKKEKMVLKEIH